MKTCVRDTFIETQSTEILWVSTFCQVLFNQALFILELEKNTNLIAPTLKVAHSQIPLFFLFMFIIENESEGV